MGLKDRVQFPEEAALGVTSKVKSLVMERLRGNVEVGVQGRWQEVSMLSLERKKTGQDANREDDLGTRSHVSSWQHSSISKRTLPPR